MSQQPYAPDPHMHNDPTYPIPVQGQQGREVNAGGVHTERQQENYIDPAGNRVERRADVYEDDNVRRANIRRNIATTIYFILGVLEVILGLRFVFRLLAANEGSGFVAFLYNFSYFFVAPFQGIFNDQNPAGSSVFEVSTLVAMLIYALAAWGLASLGRVVFAPSSDGHRSTSVTRRRSV